MLRSKLTSLALAALLAVGVAACDDDNDPGLDDPVDTIDPGLEDPVDTIDPGGDPGGLDDAVTTTVGG